MHKKITQKETVGIKGTVRIKTYVAGTLVKAQEMLTAAKKFTSYGMHESAAEAMLHFREILAEGYIATPVVQKNLIMQSPNYGQDIIIQRLCGSNTYSLNILYGEIGTGNTTPTIADTGLTTPAVRAALSFSEDEGAATAVVQFYMPDLTLPNGTYYEVGTFVDGSATIGSGQIFNHALLGTPYVKISGQDTTVEVDFAVS